MISKIISQTPETRLGLQQGFRPAFTFALRISSGRAFTATSTGFRCPNLRQLPRSGGKELFRRTLPPQPARLLYLFGIH